MSIIKNNKELLIFYLLIIVFSIISVARVERYNDKMMVEKNAYILSDNLHN